MAHINIMSFFPRVCKSTLLSCRLKGGVAVDNDFNERNDTRFYNSIEKETGKSGQCTHFRVKVRFALHEHLVKVLTRSSIGTVLLFSFLFSSLFRYKCQRRLKWRWSLFGKYDHNFYGFVCLSPFLLHWNIAEQIMQLVFSKVRCFIISFLQLSTL